MHPKVYQYFDQGNKVFILLKLLNHAKKNYSQCSILMDHISFFLINMHEEEQERKIDFSILLDVYIIQNNQDLMIRMILTYYFLLLLVIHMSFL